MAGVREAVANLVTTLLGVSTFQPPPIDLPNLGDESVNAALSALGGNLEPVPQVRLRWYPPDIERAQRQATNGDLTLVGMLCESMKLDGVYRGLSDARTSVVNFPKRYYGNKNIIDALMSKNSSDRNVYDEMIPATEARLLALDGDVVGVGVGTMVPVRGRNFPVLVRRYPQNLFYLWPRNEWYYRSTVGLLQVIPGLPQPDGSWWVLHIPGGRLGPWNSGLWNTLGRSYINKTQSIFARQSYEMRHAHPARVATSALGASQGERLNLLNGIIKWAMNAAFALPPGWKLELIESNGQGVKVYSDSIKNYNEEMSVALCGSAAMLQGTAGFSNLDTFANVATNLMKLTAGGWDHTVNTQILPGWIGNTYGAEALADAVTVETDVSVPKDRTAEANTLVVVGNAIKGLVEAIAQAQKAAGLDDERPIILDIQETLARFGVPTTLGAKTLAEVNPEPVESNPGGAPLLTP